MHCENVGTINLPIMKIFGIVRDDFDVDGQLDSIAPKA